MICDKSNHKYVYKYDTHLLIVLYNGYIFKV